MRSIPSRLLSVGLAWLLAGGLALATPALARAEEGAEPPAAAAEPTPEPAKPAAKPEQEAKPKEEAKPKQVAPEPPVFTRQPPAELTAQLGEQVTLKAKATGADQVQWQTLESATAKRGKDIEKATSASFQPDTTAAGVWYFRLVASNADGSTDSDVVKLTVAEPPATDPTSDQPAAPDAEEAPAEPEPTEPEPTTPAEDDPPSVGTDTAAPEPTVEQPADLPGTDPADAPTDPTAVVEEPAEPASSSVSPNLSRFAVSPLAGTPGASSDNGDGTSTYTHWDGETVTYPNQVVAGQSIVLSGAGWLTKPGWPIGDGDLEIREGDEGSITGIKFFGPGGAVIRNPKPANPWNGDTDYASPDVWEIAQAAGTGDWWDGATPGSWRVELPWPSAAHGAVTPPTLNPGDSFYLQLLSGTLYGNTVGAQDTRPDVSRTVRLDIAVVGDDPEPETAPKVLTALPATQQVVPGAPLTLETTAQAVPAAQAVWFRSDDRGASWQQVGAGEQSASGSVTTARLTIERPDQADGAWYKAVFSNPKGTVESGPVVLTVPTGNLPVTITTHPLSRTVEAGASVTFTAAAAGAPQPTVQWQRSVDAGASWVDLRGATSPSYTADMVTMALNGARYRAVFSNAGSPDGVATNAATLTVSPRGNLREQCGASYGPGAANSGIEFCFRGPEKVVFGQPIVIEGVGGYLATDNRTGSVVNFFLDAEFSGDPNTVYAKKLFTNPATGQQISDRRTHAIVQADAQGRWRVEIPWPTVQTVSTTSDGKGNYTQAALDAKFAPGTTHSLRMLTGSLMNNPPDRQRGASLYFTVVESLDDEVGVTQPLYEHQTFASPVAGDRAVAWLQQQVNSGQSIALTGTGWLTKDKQWGSVVTVRLLDENGDYYRRAQAGSDPTVWQVVRASEAGDLDVKLPLPAQARGGDFVAVELTTSDDGTALGDVARRWVSKPVVIDNSPYVAGPAEGATCTAAPGKASYQLAPGMKSPAANVGGTIRLTGKDWCNLVGGGSLIAIKLNDGAYSRLAGQTAPLFDANLGAEVGECPAGICVSNKTIWYVIEADEHGSFDVQIPLPTRKNSSPAFGEGAYTLRIMTRTVAADPYYQGARLDPSRTMKTPEFTVVAEGESLDDVKPGRPSAAPDPLHATDDLTKAVRGGVKVDQQAKRWVVTVPNAEPGDWVYLNVYDGASPRFPWSTWFEVDAKHQVIAPLAGASLPAGKNKLSVQDRNGAPLGWTTVTVAGSGSDDTVRPITRISRMPGVVKVGQPKPDSTPKQPVAGYADLTEANVGKATGVESDGKLTVTLPAVKGGHWVYPFLYTESGRVIGTDWVQVGTDHTITVAIGKLPNGVHKLALVTAKGELAGWVTASGPAALTGDEPPATDPGTGAGAPADAPAPPVAAEPAPPAAPAAPAGDSSGTLILFGLAFLVLAGSAAGVIALRTPVQPRP
ncbi:MAG: hypothetical protein QM804_02905 [Propionicimonas sp.]